MNLTRFSTKPLPTPQWEQNNGSESLRFTAVHAQLWVFAAMIAVVTLSMGLAVAFLATVLIPDSVGAARVLIIATSLVLCLPLVVLVKAPFRACTRTQTLTYDANAITITTDSAHYQFPLHSVTSFIWSSGSEYSRIVINEAGTQYSLLVGVARPISSQSADLPEISPGLHQILEESGLSLSVQNSGYMRYQQ